MSKKQITAAIGFAAALSLAPAAFAAQQQGFYLGASANHQNSSYSSKKTGSSTTLANGDRLAGFGLGVHAGYDYVYSRLLVGGELFGNWANNYAGTKHDDETTGFQNPYTLGGTVKVGFVANEFVRVYGLAGLAYQNPVNTNTDALIGSHLAYILGAGLQAKLTTNVALFAEYAQYMSDDNQNLTVKTVSHSAQRTVLTVGAKYYF
ncbi:MAG: outer membrane beta-barrel protein [Alphaproteobacteria bacterium]